MLKFGTRKSKKAPPREKLDQIRRILCMPRDAKFLRCPARSELKRRRLERKGDNGHSGEGHVCELCRCDRYAGYGTTGDFYGLGEEVGHFGIGFCYLHEEGRRKMMAATFAKNQMYALQQCGRAQAADQDYQQVLRYEAEEAKESKEIRDGIELIKSTLEMFKTKCNEDTLTESSKSGPVQASDKTRMELACKLAATIASLSKDRYALEKEEYIHIDELKIRLPQMMSLAMRYIMDVGDREKFVDEFKLIWSNTKKGAR